MGLTKASSQWDTFAKGDLNRDITAAMIYVQSSKGLWYTVGKAKSSGKFHAEEWLLLDLQKMSAKLGINLGARLRLEITKSPCGEGEGNHNCADQIYRYMESSTRHVSHMSIKYLGAYNTGSGLGALYAQAGIARCGASRNVDIDVWDWRTNSSPAMRKFLIEFVPGRYDTNPATRGNYAKAPEKPALKRAWDRI